jgi:hypothetical protein
MVSRRCRPTGGSEIGPAGVHSNNRRVQESAIASFLKRLACIAVGLVNSGRPSGGPCPVSPSHCPAVQFMQASPAVQLGGAHGLRGSRILNSL